MLASSYIAHRTKLLKTGKPILEKGPEQGYICNLKKFRDEQNFSILASTVSGLH
jgi:hypothetical protein